VEKHQNQEQLKELKTEEQTDEIETTTKIYKELELSNRKERKNGS